MTIGVVLVSYNTGAVLIDCLESLLAAAATQGAPEMRALVVDNASPTDPLPMLEGWADGSAPWSAEAMPFAPRDPRGPLTLDTRDLASDGRHPTLGTLSEGIVGYLQAGVNAGFAAGVNRALETFRAMPEIEYFWLLNSDAMTEADTPANLVAAARAAEAGPDGGFSMMGGRVFYTDPPMQIQSDGGWIDLSLGRARPASLGAHGRDAPPPVALDYISGSHMFVSRAFLDQSGLMSEDYFLYFEEIDWCLRRGELPLIWVPDAAVHHRAGASIGSQTLAEGPSIVAAYWMQRSRMRFVRRWKPASLPVATVYSLGKIAQLALSGHRSAARAALRGTCGLAP